MPAFAGMTSATCEMALPGSGQVLDLSTFEQNTLYRVQRQNWLVYGGTPGNWDTAVPSRRRSRLRVFDFTNLNKNDLVLNMPK